jgi:hypothetical protein
MDGGNAAAVVVDVCVVDAVVDVVACWLEAVGVLLADVDPPQPDARSPLTATTEAARIAPRRVAYTRPTLRAMAIASPSERRRELLDTVKHARGHRLVGEDILAVDVALGAVDAVDDSAARRAKDG